MTEHGKYTFPSLKGLFYYYGNKISFGGPDLGFAGLEEQNRQRPQFS